MTTKAIPQAAAANSRPIATSSAAGLFGAGQATVGSRSRGLSLRFRRRPTRSTAAATRNARALPTAEPLPEHEADADERGRRQEPRDKPLRHGADVPDRPAAAVVGVLRVLDVAHDRVHLCR